MSEENTSAETYLELTATIVSAYVSNNPVPASELPSLISSVSATISGMGKATKVEAEAQVPAVNPKRSVHDDHIVCLEDGKKFKSLKRHLMTYHGLSPEEYRAKWNLPSDYPMAAPGYSAQRSALAKKMGLGRKSQAEPTTAPAKRGRKPKAS